MKKSIFTFLASIFFLSINAQVGSWATKKSLGYDLTARSDAGMVSLNNKLYILGGYNSCGPKDFTEYNPSTGVVKKLQNLGTGCANPISGACLFAVQGKIYSFSQSGRNVYDTLLNTWTYLGGLAPSLSPDAGFVINDTIFLVSQFGNYFYSYNIVTNSFTQKTNYPGASNSRHSMAFDINGKGYWGGGRTYSTDGCSTELGCFSSMFYEYDPTTDVWVTKAPLPFAYTYLIAISNNGKGYAGTGEYYNSGPGQQIKKSQFWYEYDPIGNSWTQKQNLMNLPNAYNNSCVKDASIAKIGDEVYVFGGTAGGVNNLYSDNLYKYNTSADTWQSVNEELGNNRTDASGFYTNGKIYLGGGQDSESLNDFWEYDMASDQWTKKTSFGSFCSLRTAVELNAKGYFIGGYNDVGNTYIDSLLEYNPATNQWTAKASFPGGNRCKMVGLTYNGKLYAGMGRDFNGQTNLRDFMVYDPLTNSWTALTSAPVGFDGTILNSFALGDTAYVLTGYPSTICYKYSFLNDTWISASVNLITNGNAMDYTNQAFTYNGKGYLLYGVYNSNDELAEYDPTTGIWKKVLNMPFKIESQTIISTPNSVYMGSGYGNTYTNLGIIRTNDWWQLNFNSKVSNQIGIYNAIINNSYQTTCGTGNVSPNSAHSIYDSKSNLFAAVIANNVSTLSTTCLEINSTDTLQPYRSTFGNFGHAYNENGIFLNKSVLFPNEGSIPNGGTLRLYYTSRELTNFVQAFNSQYSSNKTIDSVKILKYYKYGYNDNDPLNNDPATSYYTIYNPTITPYGPDKYFELPTGALIMGEIYAVLTTTNVVTSAITNYKNNSVSVYPNPTTGILNINLSDVHETELVLYNITGQKIISKTIHDKVATIDLNGLSNGVYYLQVKNENGIDTKKIILNK